MGGDVRYAAIIAFIVNISIHASTMGGDPYKDKYFIGPSDFNPRLHYGRRLFPKFQHSKDLKKFQSTPPLWEATSPIFLIKRSHINFNPRLHYGRRLSDPQLQPLDFRISIHASTMGGDDSGGTQPYISSQISIHASTMGGD